MELGSQVCTPQSPACDRCPLAKWCAARQRGLVDQMPKLRRKPKIEAVREAAIVVWRNNKVLLHQRAAHERWAGLWDFLRFPIESRTKTNVERELLATASDRCGLNLHSPAHLATLKHGVTRFRITLDCYSVRASSAKVRMPASKWQWVEPAQLEQFPLCVTGRKLGRLLIKAADGQTAR
jgi:A/G-specific adenine glycosylase